MSHSNISKYIQLNDYVLLEYQFNKTNSNTNDVDRLGGFLINSKSGYKQYIEQKSNTKTNNNFEFNSLPLNTQKSEWFYSFVPSEYVNYIHANETQKLKGVIGFDTIKIHILSGYQFNDVDGFLLQINIPTNDGKKLTLSNFSWNKFIKNQHDKTIYFSKNTLFIGNKTYDKYIQLQIPSVFELGSYSDVNDKDYIINALNVKRLSDIEISYSSIPLGLLSIKQGNIFHLNDIVKLQFPIVSMADNFNCYVAESNNGDYIEYFATWDNRIIGDIMDEIETGRISLYTSNNPNDNYSEFEEIWGDERKWVLIHEIEIKEFLPGNSVLSTNRYNFTQNEKFSYPNLFRPIILNDEASSFNIEYTCRLMNRMDGSQIIRKSSFNSSNPRKYSKKIQRLNTDNIINYSIINKIQKNENIINNIPNNNILKYVKVFYDSYDIVLESDGNTYTQGNGPLYLKEHGGLYKFNFSSLKNGEKTIVDLSGMYGYRLYVITSDGEKISIYNISSNNTNSTIGQLEFNVNEENTTKLLNSQNNIFSIQVKNADNSYHTLYQGKYFSLKNKNNG